MKNPLFSIIIINYNGSKHLKECLDSIEKQSYKNFEIIFVDNNSKDDSVKIVKNISSRIKIIKNSLNLGFAEANNQGIKVSKGEEE